MPWVKHSDQRWCDPEFARLSDGAQALWFRADSYTASQLLDGFLPEDALRHMRTRKRYIDELVREGWWKHLEAGDPLAGDWRSTGGWLAVGWQERMRCKVDVLATRSEAKQRVSSKRSQEQKAKFAPPDPVPVKIPEEKEEKRERDHAHAREASEVEIQNHDPAPGLVPPKPPTHEPPPRAPKPDRVRVHELLAEALGRTVDQLAPDLVSAERVGAAARAESGPNDQAFEAVVRRMLAAWQGDPHPLAKKHSIANMVAHLAKYTAPVREAVKPVRKAPVMVPHPYLPHSIVTPEKRDEILAELDRMKRMGQELAAHG